MTWEEAEKFVASVLDRMEHESIQEAARRLLDLDATFAEMVAGVNTRDATIAALRAENIRLRGEVDMYKGALEMMQPAPKEQAEHGMGAMPPVPDEVAQLRAEVERAKSIIENYELDYDRVVVRGEKCAMEQAVEEAATLRAEVERLKEQNGKLANSLAVRNQECNAARSAMLRTTTDSLKDYVNYKEALAATDADGGCK